jgi:hypothetical protein
MSYVHNVVACFTYACDSDQLDGTSTFRHFRICSCEDSILNHGLNLVRTHNNLSKRILYARRLENI